MTAQVLVKLAAPEHSPVRSLVLGSPGERQAFVESPYVFWYMYPEQDDWAWRRGGGFSPLPAGEPLPGPDLADWNSPEDSVYDEDDDDEDARW